MGSFHSTPKIMNSDSQDDDLLLDEETIAIEEMLQFCRMERPLAAMLLGRTFSERPIMEYSSKLDAAAPIHSDKIRVLQWNILAQTLGQMADSFIKCPPEALMWDIRKYTIVEEIVRYSPDIICLQEVDHFKFLQRMLNTQGYEGVFYEKPDSPCLYFQNNNGPDGCAIFYKRDKFECLDTKTRILEVWSVPSNQVAIAMLLKSKLSGKEVCLATTHLKAKKGALLTHVRNEQARDLTSFVSAMSGERPVIITGDFNGEPTEPFYKTMQYCADMELASSYSNFHLSCGAAEKLDEATNEIPYTTWKIREHSEECHTIDYVFYSPRQMHVEGVLDMPTPAEIGEGRLPSMSYPSDHLSLAVDFSF